MPRSYAFGVYPGCVLNSAKLYPSVSGSTEATMEYRTARVDFATDKMQAPNSGTCPISRRRRILETSPEVAPWRLRGFVKVVFREDGSGSMAACSEQLRPSAK